jgi:hypothetical protein
MGFYKNDNGSLIWSADRVLNENFELWLDQKDTYTYPVEGWYWFDSEIEARRSLKCYGIQPFPSWVLNETTCQWEAPVPYPTDGKYYDWNEADFLWKEMVE